MAEGKMIKNQMPSKDESRLSFKMVQTGSNQTQKISSPIASDELAKQMEEEFEKQFEMFDREQEQRVRNESLANLAQQNETGQTN